MNSYQSSIINKEINIIIKIYNKKKYISLRNFSKNTLLIQKIYSTYILMN